MSQEIITIQEKIDWYHQVMQFHKSIPDYYPESYYHANGIWNSTATKISRRLVDDLFSVFIKPNAKWMDHWKYKEVPFVNIGNKSEVTGRDNSVFPQWTKEKSHDPEFWWNIRPEDIGRAKFHANSLVVAGTSLYGENGFSPIWGLNQLGYYFTDAPKIITGSFDQIIELKAINEVLTHNALKSDSDSSGVYPYAPWDLNETFPNFKYANIRNREKVKNPGKILTESYFSVYIQPIKPSQLYPNQKLANVFVSKNDHYEDSLDYAFSVGDLKTTSLKSGTLATYFNQKPYRNWKLPNIESTYIGSIEVADYTYYDYDKEQVVKGTESDNAVGERIPYNFSGDLVWELPFTANASFKDMKLRFTSAINQPVLDSTGGMAQLTYGEENNIKDIPTLYFDEDDFRELGATEENLSLIALRRLMNEE